METINDLSMDTIMDRMLSRIDNKYDKRETSICYQSVAMVAPEILNLKSDLLLMEQEAFPDTCNYINLLRFCKFRSIQPYPATQGEVKAVFNIDVELGTRFNCDLRNYTVVSKLDEAYTYKLLAEESGHIESYGELTPINDVLGLKTAYISEVIIDGKDEEEVEHLRDRYIQSLDYQAFGGNRADYRNKILSIENVGGVKLFRRKQSKSSEFGRIEAIIVDSNFNGCDSSLVEYVQNFLYPNHKDVEGDGVGLAPIGHIVEVRAVNKQDIDIHTSITLQDDTDDTDEIIDDIKIAIKEYFKDLAMSFGEDNEDSVVRISHIENKILSIRGVIDVEHTTLNGAEKNITINEKSIPNLKEVSYDKRK